MELVQSRNMRVANAVLALLAKAHGPRLMVSGFVNGREQGYHVTNYKAGVSFSESRNSDEVTVQYGLSRDFSMQGHVLHNEGSIYSGRTSFDTPEEAVEWIVKFLVVQHPNSLQVAGTEENDIIVI